MYLNSLVLLNLVLILSKYVVLKDGMDLRPLFNFFHHSKDMFELLFRSKKLAVQFLEHLWMDLTFQLKIGSKLWNLVSHIGWSIFSSQDHQDLAKNWCHISAPSIFGNFHSDLNVNSLSPHFIFSLGKHNCSILTFNLCWTLV